MILYIYNSYKITNDIDLILLNHIDYKSYIKIINIFYEYNDIKNIKLFSSSDSEESSNDLKNIIINLGKYINDFANNYADHDILKDHEDHSNTIDNEINKVFKNNKLTINNSGEIKLDKDKYDIADINIILNYIFPNFVKDLSGSTKKITTEKTTIQNNHMIYDPYFYYKLFNNTADITKIFNILSDSDIKLFDKNLLEKMVNYYFNENDKRYTKIQPITRIVIFLELFNIDNINTPIINGNKNIKDNIDEYYKNRRSNKGVNRLFPIPINETIKKWKPKIKNIMYFFFNKYNNQNNNLIKYFRTILTIITKVCQQNATNLTAKHNGDSYITKINYIINNNENYYFLEFGESDYIKSYPTNIIKYISPQQNTNTLPKYYKLDSENFIELNNKKVAVNLANKRYDNIFNEKFKIKLKLKDNEKIDTYLLVPLKIVYDNESEIFDNEQYKLYINIDNFDDNNMYILCYRDDNNYQLLHYNNFYLYFKFKKLNEYYYYYNIHSIFKNKNYADIIHENKIQKINKDINDIKNELTTTLDLISNKKENSNFDDIRNYYLTLNYSENLINEIIDKIKSEYIQKLTEIKNIITNLLSYYDEKANNIDTFKNTINDITEANVYNIKALNENYNDYLSNREECYQYLINQNKYNENYIEDIYNEAINTIKRAVVYAEDNIDTINYESPGNISFYKNFKDYDKINQNKLALSNFLKTANKHEDYIIKIKKLIENISKYYKKNISDIQNYSNYSNYSDDSSDKDNNYSKILLDEFISNCNRLIYNYKELISKLYNNISKFEEFIYNISKNKNNINSINTTSVLDTIIYEYHNITKKFEKYLKLNEDIEHYYNMINMLKTILDAIRKSIVSNNKYIKINREKHEIIKFLEKLNYIYSDELLELSIGSSHSKNLSDYINVVNKILKLIQTKNYDNDKLTLVKQYFIDKNDTDITNMDTLELYDIVKDVFKKKLIEIFHDQEIQINKFFELFNYALYDDYDSSTIENIKNFLANLNKLSLEKKIKTLQNKVFKRPITDKEYNHLKSILSEDITFQHLIEYKFNNIKKYN
jgi:hypothetical protein